MRYKPLIICLIALITTAAAPRAGAQAEAGAQAAAPQNTADQDMSGQPSFNFRGKSFYMNNTDENGILQITPDAEGNYSEVYMKGEVELISDTITLHCNEMNYSSTSGTMVATADEGKQAMLVQNQAQAYADKIVFFEATGDAELTGNAQIIQVGVKNITHVFGEEILQKEKEDGSSLIFVRKSPRMNNFPNPDAAATTETATVAATASENEANQTAQAGQMMQQSFGDKITLVADKDKGEFELTLNTQGTLAEFIARNKVDLQSDKLNLKSDKLVLEEEGTTITATGSPVQIEQGNIDARCHQFVYKTKSRTSELTGDPHVYQKQADGPPTHATANKIILVEDEAGNMLPTFLGQPKVFQGQPAQVELPPSQKTETAPGPASPVQKIETDNVDSIPQIDISPEL